jgi:hypothetical protein
MKDKNTMFFSFFSKRKQKNKGTKAKKPKIHAFHLGKEIVNNKAENIAPENLR